MYGTSMHFYHLWSCLRLCTVDCIEISPRGKRKANTRLISAGESLILSVLFAWPFCTCAQTQTQPDMYNWLMALSFMVRRPIARAPFLGFRWQSLPPCWYHLLSSLSREMTSWQTQCIVIRKR